MRAGSRAYQGGRGGLWTLPRTTAVMRCESYWERPGCGWRGPRELSRHPGGCGEQRADRGSDPIGHHCWTGGIKLAIQVQERKPVDERPDRGGERLGVGLREGALDDRPNVVGDRRGRGIALIVVSIAWLAEHDAEQGGPFERELHVGDRHARE